jgi:hypothetical protein
MAIDPPAIREKKVRRMAVRLRDICAAKYETLSSQQQGVLAKMLDEFDSLCNAYRGFEIPWDGQVIDTFETVGNVKVKTKEITTFETPAEKAREIYCYVMA